MGIPSDPRDSTGRGSSLKFGGLSDGREGIYNSGLAVTENRFGARTGRLTIDNRHMIEADTLAPRVSILESMGYEMCGLLTHTRIGVSSRTRRRKLVWFSTIYGQILALGH